MTGMWLCMSALKFVSNKYTVLYFREDKSTCRICTVTVEELLLLSLKLNYDSRCKQQKEIVTNKQST
jgi:hypothetical protein